MEFKIPNKNKKKRKVVNKSPGSSSARGININYTRSLLQNGSSSSTSATLNTTVNSELNTDQTNEQKSSQSLNNSLLNSSVIPEKLKKLFRIFQTINKYYTLKQSRNTELFVFENYKSIIENELKWYIYSIFIIFIIFFIVLVKHIFFNIFFIILIVKYNLLN